VSKDLTVTALTVEYQAGGQVVRPLEGFELQAAAGSFVLLFGPSGSGKTTLLSCLAGLLSPVAGTITFDGVEVSALKGRQLSAYRRSTVGVVFQGFNLLPSMTALDNVVAPLLAARVPRSEAARRATELLEQVGLHDRMGHRPGELSGGQQQRVAIARALVHDPPLILADEPTAHLDRAHVEGALRLLEGLVARDRLVVVATHDDRLRSISTQVVDLAARGATPTG
jgi:putative ABC transport system ATP-binding protein